MRILLCEEAVLHRAPVLEDSKRRPAAYGEMNEGKLNNTGMVMSA